MIVYGHRGAAGEAPENTLGGFFHAVERGVRHVELDVRLSADQQLVVIHDNKVDRTTSSNGKVSDLSAKKLARLDARRTAPPWGNKEGVPTLHAVMSSLPEIETWQIEVKPGAKKVQQAIASKLAEVSDELELPERAVVTSIDTRVLGHMAELAPDIPRGYIAMRPNPLPTAEEYGCEYLIAHWQLCTPRLKYRASKLGLHISVWTINDATLIKSFYRLGVDSLITDYPSMALPLIGQMQSRQ